MLSPQIANRGRVEIEGSRLEAVLAEFGHEVLTSMDGGGNGMSGMSGGAPMISSTISHRATIPSSCS